MDIRLCYVYQQCEQHVNHCELCLRTYPKKKKTIQNCFVIHSLVLHSLLHIRKLFEVQCNVQVQKFTQLSSLSLIKYKNVSFWKKKKRGVNNSTSYMLDSHVILICFVSFSLVHDVVKVQCREGVLRGRRGGEQALSGRVFDFGCLCITGDTGASGSPPW